MTLDYYNDEKELLSEFINSYFYEGSDLRDIDLDKDKVPFTTKGIELIIRPQCNQTCEYCYIYQHGKDLYPYNERANNETLIKNLRAVLKHVYIDRKAFINHWEIFAGDLFGDGLWFDLMDVFFEFLEPLHKQYTQLFKMSQFCILMPCNCAFVEDDEKYARFQEYIDHFKALDVDFHISWSTDGKYMVDTREKRAVDDEYFERGFKLAEKYAFGIHPMIAAENIENAVENYDWFVEEYAKYDLMRFEPPFLEVRNDNWTDEKIAHYQIFLKHVIDSRFARCNNNVDEFTYHLFIGDGANGTLPAPFDQDFININVASFEDGGNKISCALPNLLHINLNNMTLPLCHRLTYWPTCGGKYVQDEQGDIIDLVPNNVSGYIGTKVTNAVLLPKCSNCYFT